MPYGAENRFGAIAMVVFGVVSTWAAFHLVDLPTVLLLYSMMIEAVFFYLITSQAQLPAHVLEVLIPRDATNPSLGATLASSGL